MGDYFLYFCRFYRGLCYNRAKAKALWMGRVSYYRWQYVAKGETEIICFTLKNSVAIWFHFDSTRHPIQVLFLI